MTLVGFREHFMFQLYGARNPHKMRRIIFEIGFIRVLFARRMAIRDFQYFLQGHCTVGLWEGSVSIIT